MKKMTALLTCMMMIACMAAAPVQAAHTFENERTDDYCSELLESCTDCYTLDADGVYTYTKCVYHTSRNMFEPYIANPGTYDRSDLLLSLARIHPESKYRVKIQMYGDLDGEVERLVQNGISVTTNPETNSLYAVMNAEQVENFPASEKVGYLLSLAPLPEETTAPETKPASVPDSPKGDLNGDGTTDIMDVIRLNKVLLGIEKLTDAQNAAADLDGDGKMTPNDALALLKNILGIADHKSSTTAANLSASYTAQPVQTVEIDEQTILGQTKFALDLLRNSAKPGKNSLVSPYSVSQALGMTANGAAGNTLQEMETVLGGSMETLNPAFYTLRTRDTKDAKCVTANSIWMWDRYFTENPVNPAFLQTNADYYGADVFTAPFDDTTLKDINNWVNDKTDNMIPEILDEIPDDAAMYLINAVAFDAEWENPYGGCRDGKFLAADGTEQPAKMLMHDNYKRYYYETAHGVGFRENYKGGQYYFAAFLPETGMTPEEYLNSMTAEELHETLQNPKKGRVLTELPKFTYDFDIKLNDALSTMGMPSAFLEGPESDFSRVRADNFDNLYINRVLHKTHIEVSELGTRAGAATAVELCIESVPDATLYFNRPFLYMIADSETNLPVFIGIVNSVS